MNLNVLPDHLAVMSITTQMPAIALVARESGMTYQRWQMLCRQGLMQSYRGAGENIDQFLARVRVEVFLSALSTQH